MSEKQINDIAAKINALPDGQPLLLPHSPILGTHIVATTDEVKALAASKAELERKLAMAVDMLLFCPNCFEQHVDEATPDVCELCGHSEQSHRWRIDHKRDMDKATWCHDCECKDFTPWLNPPHKSHRCTECNHVWRPADVPTNGVQKLETSGKADGSARPVAFANGKDFDDSVATATKRLTEYVKDLENTAPVRRETINRLIHHRNENKRLTDENARLREGEAKARAMLKEVALHHTVRDHARKILAELGGK